MDNYHTMKTRLNYCGGLTQQERMIADKKASLDYAIMHSYQGAQVYANGETALALINPNTVKQDYDDKIISIGKEHNYKVGTIFEWVHKDPNKNTKWLIYLQDLTELAYFKGNIRKCNYEIKWEVKNEQGEKTEQSTYVALTGPSEGQLNSATASGISIDSPNYTLHFYMPNNEATASYFDRYSKFYLQGLPTCWRVEAIDKISMPGILEIYAQEYYINEHEDDVGGGLVGSMPVEPIAPEYITEEIVGDIFIKPKMSYTYIYEGTRDGNWLWDQKYPIKLISSAEENGKQIITIKWNTTQSGQFVLAFGNSMENAIKKTVVVESLF